MNKIYDVIEDNKYKIIHSIYKHIAPLPYITWGLIQDLKTNREDSNIYILRQLLLK